MRITSFLYHVEITYDFQQTKLKEYPEKMVWESSYFKAIVKNILTGKTTAEII